MLNGFTWMDAAKHVGNWDMKTATNKDHTDIIG
jgi:hypothetical protein